MTKNILTYQEVKTTNDVNGNPRAIVLINIIYIDKPLHQEVYYIELGYRTARQTVEENFKVEDYQVARLETINLAINEYKRIRKSHAYSDDI